jgi:type I restriction enzyme S subunit
VVAERIKASATEQAVPMINKSEFEKILVYLPQEKEEQTRIATILSDMDAEIEAMEAELQKQRAIKEGLMQELLTGKRRLK